MIDRDRHVRTALLRRALHGTAAPGDLEAAVAAATGLSAGHVRAALTALHNAGVIYLRDGGVVAAYPFSFVPTAHRVIVEGTTVYANCAIDALAVPPMVDAGAQVASTCAHCGIPIHVAMQGPAVLRAAPAAAVVFHVASDCCADGPAVLTRCPHIRFFCVEHHAAEWLAGHPDLRGTVLAMADAAAYAARHFATTIDAVRGVTR